MNKHITVCGVPGIGPVPRDFHVCHFFPSRVELIEALIPYFEAGIQNKEFCIWIASSPLPVIDIYQELDNHSILENAVASGQLIIVDAVEWHGQSSEFNADALVDKWIVAEERAMADGYLGLRIAGHASGLSRNDWANFMEYERKFHDMTRGRRIIACCNYAREDCRPTDILEVTRRHNAAMDRDAQNWHVHLQESSSSGRRRVSKR